MSKPAQERNRAMQADLDNQLARMPRHAADGGERRCIVTRRSGPRLGLIRFVVAPGGTVVADLAEKLPGRGLWVSADRQAVEAARARQVFARAAGQPVTVASDLAEIVERQLAERCIALIGLARRADQVVAGTQAVREAAAARTLSLRLCAADSPRAAAIVGEDVSCVLTESELGAAMGRATAREIGIKRGRLGSALTRDLGRLAGFRSAPKDDAPGASMKKGKTTVHG